MRNNKTIIANDNNIKSIVEQEIEKYGNEANLNHIDVSNVTNMNGLFSYQHFNGNISEWDVKNVKNMSWMFSNSQFNGDISKWDVGNVKDMSFMFYDSQFNSDISQWNVSNVKNMSMMFKDTNFKGNLSNWNVSESTDMSYMFYGSDQNFNLEKYNRRFETIAKREKEARMDTIEEKDWIANNNTSDKEIDSSIKPYNKDKVDFTLKISLNDGFDDKVKEYLDKSGITNNVLSADKAIFALQTLNEADELILKKAVDRNEMPKSSIRLEMLTSNGEKIDLPKVEMGRYLFKNADLNKIINVSSSKIAENQISEDTQKAFSNLLSKDANGKFKTNVNLENIFDNGIKSLESIADSIGDEHLSNFVKNFTTAYNIINTGSKDKPLTKNDLENIIKDKDKEAKKDNQKEKYKIPDSTINIIKKQTSEAVAKIKKTKEKEKSITKPTDISRGI